VRSGCRSNRPQARRTGRELFFVRGAREGDVDAEGRQRRAEHGARELGEVLLGGDDEVGARGRGLDLAPVAVAVAVVVAPQQGGDDVGAGSAQRR
jgi:hypothetical protein